MNYVALYKKNSLIATVPYDDIIAGDRLVIMQLSRVPWPVKQALMRFAAKSSRINNLNDWTWSWKSEA